MRTRFRLPLVIAISILPSVFGNLSAQDTKPQPTQCSVVRVLQNGSIQAQNLIRLKDAEIASHNAESLP